MPLDALRLLLVEAAAFGAALHAAEKTAEEFEQVRYWSAVVDASRLE